MIHKLISVIVAVVLCCTAGAAAQETGSGIVRDFVRREDSMFYKFGFTDGQGNVKIPYMYDYAEPFSCGYALVRQGEKLFFIDAHNRPAFGSDKSGYKFFYSFKEDLCVVEKDGKSGYIDTAGNVAIDLMFDEAYSFSEGLAAVGKDGKIGYINKNGEVVIDFQFTEGDAFQNGYARVEKDGRCGFINASGGLGTPLIYEAASQFSEGLARVKLNGRYTYVDENGFLYFPPVFEEASDFEGGAALVKIDDKYGYIRHDGTYMIAPRFDYLSEFHGDYAIAGRFVADGVLWYGLVDRQGNRVYPFSYDKISYLDGQYIVTKNGRTIFLDETLQQVIEQ